MDSLSRCAPDVSTCASAWPYTGERGADDEDGTEGCDVGEDGAGMDVNGRDADAGVERSESVVVDDEESCVGGIIDGVCVGGGGSGGGSGGGEKVGVDVGRECIAQHGDCRRVRLRASRQAANVAAADGVTRSSAAAAHLARFVVGSGIGASNVGTGGGLGRGKSVGESHAASGGVDDAGIWAGTTSCVVVGVGAVADVGVCELGGGV